MRAGAVEMFLMAVEIVPFLALEMVLSGAKPTVPLSDLSFVRSLSPPLREG